MDIIINLWNNWTTYEKINTLILILIILLIIPGLVWLFTKRSQLASISILSLLISGVLILISLIILNLVFDIAITYTFKLIPFITIFIAILRIGNMTGFYMQNHKHREFNIAQMKSEMLNDAVRLTVTCILLFSGFAILTPSILLPILLSLGLSLATIWIHYLLVYKLLK